MKTKRLLCIVMSLLIAFSFTCIAFAGDAPEISKTEAFIKKMENGVGVNANLNFINGVLYVKKDKAAANVTIGPLNARAVLNGDKFAAYLSIFRVDLNEVLSSHDINEIKGIVNEIPKALAQFDTEEIFKYLDVTGTKTNGAGNFVETFGPDYEEIAKLIVEENPDALQEKDADDIVAFCEYFAENDKTIGALLNSAASFTFEDEKAETLIAASVTLPDERGNLKNIDLFSALADEIGIRISFITVDVDDGVFKAPLAILNITWLIKLIMKLA